MSMRIPRFRLGIHAFKNAEAIDFAAPYGVFSVARRFDPKLEVFSVTQKSFLSLSAFAPLRDIILSSDILPALTAFAV